MPIQRPEPPRAPPVRLTGTDRLATLERTRLGAEIVAAYATVRVALLGRPIEATVERIREPQGPRNPPSPGGFEEACRLGHAVARTLAHLPGDTRCLVRSLVLTRLLARRGIPSRLVIGVRSGQGFLAHAWVEHGGEAVLDPGDGSFGRLVEL